MLFLEIGELRFGTARFLVGLRQTGLQPIDRIHLFAVLPIHFDEVGRHGVALAHALAHELDAVLEPVELLEQGAHRAPAGATKRGVPLAGHPWWFASVVWSRSSVSVPLKAPRIPFVTTRSGGSTRIRTEV